MQYLRSKMAVLKNTAKLETVAEKTSGYATWFTAGGAIRIAHYDAIDGVINS